MLIHKGAQIGILMCLYKCGQTPIEIKRTNERTNEPTYKKITNAKMAN